jgi:hypothetical protein
MASIESQLKKLVATKIRDKSGHTLAEKLKREVDRLYDCIQHYIDEWYNTYDPIAYKRTWRFQDAMYAEDIIDIQVIGNQITMRILFNNDLSYHPNFNDKHESFVPLLMNQGWQAPKLATKIGKSVPMLTEFSGVHFIERGIRDWNRTNSLGIRITAIGRDDGDVILIYP